MFKKGLLLMAVFGLSFVAIGSQQTAHAAVLSDTMYWVGTSTDYFDNDNWSLTSGGPSAGRFPADFDYLVFDDGSSFDCVLDQGISFRDFTVESTYTGDIYFPTSYEPINVDGNITLSSASSTLHQGEAVFYVTGDLIMNAGTFNGGFQNFTLDGGFDFNGGTFIAPGGSFQVTEFWDQEAGTTFDNQNNGSVVLFVGDGVDRNYDSAVQNTFYDFSIDMIVPPVTPGKWYLNDSLIIAGNFYGWSGVEIHLGNFLTMQGNFRTFEGQIYAGTTQITGNNVTIVGGSRFYNLVKNNPGAHTLLFGDSGTTVITNALSLYGSIGADLTIESTGHPGSAATIDPQGAVGIDRIVVNSMNNIGDVIDLSAAYATDGGNNTGWIFTAAVPEFRTYLYALTLLSVLGFMYFHQKQLFLAKQED